MKTMVSTYEAKAHLSQLIAQVERTGQAITICRNRKPTVDIVVHRAKRDPLRQDPALKGARFRGDPCALVTPEDWPEDLR
ncbi:MAG: type II toxin-antitoxin system Phd/YefM family antitoxin [Kiritimatiellae bacterium]|nr:type II toxin-antitoxin system Phd/YefM family antitoxin [Kiritimatiellia bacterium]